MGSYCYGGSVRLNPEIEENDRDSMFDGGYPYSMPKVFLHGLGEEYYPQMLFNWDEDSVILVRGKRVTEYRLSHYCELLAENENGEIIWVDGRNAPYEGCWSGHYLDDARGKDEYTIIQYDIDKKEKRTFKVSLTETSELSAGDLHRISDFVADEDLGGIFDIKDGKLVDYVGREKDIIIPESVTKIGYNGLGYLSEFNSITIPKSVVDISEGIPFTCKAKCIKVDGDNPRYYSKDGCLIDRETGTLVWAFAATNIPDDNSIKNIASYAFARRDDLESVVIPDSVQTINCSAFWKCDSLKEICTSGVGIDVSEVILGKSYIRKGDEWTVNIPACGRSNSSFAGFCF